MRKTAALILGGICTIVFAAVETISIADSIAIPSATEIVFTITRAGGTNSRIVMPYGTVDGSAMSGVDYGAASGYLVFDPTIDEMTLSVPILSTPSAAGKEFFVAVQSPTHSLWATPISHNSGANPVTITAADFNSDGRPDLAVANESSDTVSIHVNGTESGADIVSFASGQSFATGLNPAWVISADIDDDGVTDLVSADLNANKLSVRLNATNSGTSELTFGALQSFATGNAPQSVAAADIDGDGKVDLVTADQVDNTVTVLRNTTIAGTGSAAFAAAEAFAAGSGPICIALADFNDDGKVDIAVSNAFSDSVSVLLNSTASGAASPTFTEQAAFAVGDTPFRVIARDINGDGAPDLVAANLEGSTVSVLINTMPQGASLATFAAQAVFSVGRPLSLDTADLNFDGRLDLIVGTTGSPFVAAVLLNATTAATTEVDFGAVQGFISGVNGQAVATADFDGDGKEDIGAVAGNQSLYVLLNTLGRVTINDGLAKGTIQPVPPTQTGGGGGAVTLSSLAVLVILFAANWVTPFWGRQFGA